MSTDVQLIVLGWALGLVSAGGAGFVSWARSIRRQNKLKLVAAHYATGTALRYEGSRMELDLLDTWLGKYNEWHAAMIADARAVDPVRAENVNTLLNYPVREFPGVRDGRLIHKLSDLTETLERLAVFISQ